MNHIKVFGIKFAVITFTVLAIFGVFHRISIGTLLGISLLTTLVSYVIGDMLILRAFGNVIATVADFVLAFASLWMLAIWFIGPGGYPIESMSLLSAVLITCVEPFLHRYILQHIPPKTLSGRRTSQLQTEFAKETDAQDIYNDKDHSNRRE